MSVLAIIPARGGSKGIPRKNLHPIGGKPLIAWSIELSLQTSLVDRVVVSTDDDEIANVSQEWGAEVVRRPADISGDEASSESALLHVLDHLRAADGYEPELVVFLQATSPIRQPDDIEKAIQCLREEQADSLFSGRHVEGFTWRQSGASLEPINYDPATRKRRQDLDERIVEENGSIYVFKPAVLRGMGSRLGGRIACYLMDELDSFQIDTLEDVERVERLIEQWATRFVETGIFADVELLVLDFDGVLTDNRVFVHQDGVEAVACHRGDSLGLERARRAGLEVLVLSKETNPVVQARCAKLQIGCISGCDDKPTRLRELVAERSLRMEQVAYVGNDVNDLECMRLVGVSVAVGDAVPEVRRAARVVTTAHGGYGAVREVTDWILKARQRT